MTLRFVCNEDQFLTRRYATTRLSKNVGTRTRFCSGINQISAVLLCSLVLSRDCLSPAGLMIKISPFQSETKKVPASFVGVTPSPAPISVAISVFAKEAKSYDTKSEVSEKAVSRFPLSINNPLGRPGASALKTVTVPSFY
jgi:hypothetical protein